MAAYPDPRILLTRGMVSVTAAWVFAQGQQEISRSE